MDKPKIPQMCRLCLSRKPFFYNFVDTKNNWAALTKQLTGIDPFADTRYPQKLCVNCRKKLDAWSAFRKKCLKSQIQFGKEFLDNQPSLDMEVEMEIPSLAPLTVEMKMPSLAPLSVAAASSKPNCKPEKYFDWSDDEFFNPEKVKIKEESEEDEFFELVVVVDDEEVKEDTNPIKSEEVDTKPEPIQIEKMLDVRTEENKDKVSSTDSEPDFFDFEPVPEAKIPRRKGPGPPAPCSVCHICGISTKRYNMEFHLNSHNDLRPYPCTFEGCTQSFNSPKQQKSHLLRHFEPTVDCTVCCMKLFERKDMNRHMLRHTKKWLNVCPHCSKKCATPYNLKVHLRIHTGDRPFSCKNCKASFAYNSLLKTHKEKCKEMEDESSEEQLLYKNFN